MLSCTCIRTRRRQNVLSISVYLYIHVYIRTSIGYAGVAYKRLLLMVSNPVSSTSVYCPSPPLPGRPAIPQCQVAYTFFFSPSLKKKFCSDVNAKNTSGEKSVLFDFYGILNSFRFIHLVPFQGDFKKKKKKKKAPILTSFVTTGTSRQGQIYTRKIYTQTYISIQASCSSNAIAPSRGKRVFWGLVGHVVNFNYVWH